MALYSTALKINKKENTIFFRIQSVKAKQTCLFQMMFAQSDKQYAHLEEIHG